jgi:DmsE family decaheme c-type cytochrome
MSANSDGTSRCRRFFLAGHLSLLALFAGVPVTAQDEEPEFSRRGADQCIGCHDDEAILSIFRTPHGQLADSRTPFANLQCESCHGPGGKHAARLRRGQERPPITNFGSDEHTPAAEQNDICMGCHTASAGLGWHGSAPEREDVACADCHQAHAPVDRVRVRAEQAEVCFDCHQTVRAQSFKPFSHPVREGKMSCAGCHDIHGSIADNLLARSNVNQTCYGCHAEKRGPFLWEHAPVTEDCTTCHDAHGSNHPAQLTRRPPLLCQQCHSQAGHPGRAFTDSGLADNNPSVYLLGGSCLNCHSKVHGSNHPSGINLMR